jgi:hypothetical protein
MKMKSKFVGFNVMVALALLAAGSMFTSCYDTENGDVNLPPKDSEPYVAPAPVYTIVGQVTDAVTGGPASDVIITFSGALTFDGVIKTDEDGNYRASKSVDGGASGTVTIKAEKDGKEISGDITVESTPNGETAVYIKNLRLNPPTFDDTEVKVKTDTKTDEETVEWQGEYPAEDNYVVGLDLVNNTDAPMTITQFFKVQDGAKLLSGAAPVTRAATRAIDPELDDYALDYIAGIEGTLTQTSIIEEVTFEIPAKRGLKEMVITYTLEYKTYTFIYGNEEVVYTVERIIRRKYTPVLTPADEYFGHGHGHGHGHSHGDANAGGGIWE